MLVENDKFWGQLRQAEGVPRMGFTHVLLELPNLRNGMQSRRAKIAYCSWLTVY